jgi:CRP-like cAMP-binding protein
MTSGALGKVYKDGEIIIRQGDVGDCMYVVQEGQVEIVDSVGDQEVRLAVRRAGDFIGEMAVLEREVRSASVRALGDARLLTVDKRNLLSRIHEDPSFAYRLIQSLCSRVRELSSEVAQLKQDSRRPD